MSAFTQKPDLSAFLKKANASESARRSAIRSVRENGGQAVPGMGERNRAKTVIHLKGTRG